jgi:hypothetical protein
MKKWMMFLAMSLTLAGIGTAWAGDLQDPGDGMPPQGFAFADDATGARVNAVNVSEFRNVPLVCDDFNNPTGFARGSGQLVSVLRVRKAGTLAAMSHVMDCGICPTACSVFPVCDGNAPPAGTSLVSQSKIAEIQACLLADLSEDIGEAILDDPDAMVRLKSVDEFIAAPPIDESASEITQHFVADVELSVK